MANGLSFFEATFLSELPLAPLRRPRGPARRRAPRLARWLELPPFLRVGSWIGGDRDGNPFVTARVLDEALAMQCARALGFTSTSCTARLAVSLALLLVSPSGAHGAAERSPDLPHRSDEPLPARHLGIYARLSATCGCCSAMAAPRHPVGEAEPYADAAALAADLDRAPPRSRATARGRSRGRLRLRRAVAVFEFSPGAGRPAPERRRNEQVVAELLAVARRGGPPGARRGGRIALLLEEIASPRPLYSPYVTYSELSTGELAILRMAREAHQRYGTDSVPNCIISKTDGVSDMLELALLLKETGLLSIRAPPPWR